MRQVCLETDYMQSIAISASFDSDVENFWTQTSNL
jgi:hypothetical protein